MATTQLAPAPEGAVLAPLAPLPLPDPLSASTDPQTGNSDKENPTEKALPQEWPPQGMEWVDGQLIEKTGMTVKHSLTQSNLVALLRSFADANQLGGKPLTEVACRTRKQIRRPDVGYLPPDILAVVIEETTLPEPPPFVAEVVSPDDAGEMVLAKAAEYLAAGALEVWLLFPLARLVLRATAAGWAVTSGGEVASEAVLPGFRVGLDQLFG